MKNVGLIYSWCVWYKESENKKEITELAHNNFEGNPIYEHMINCIAGTPLWFCPKSILVDIGGFEDTPCKQDSVVLLKILLKGYNVFRVPKELVECYLHGKDGISGVKPSNIEGMKIYREWCRKNYCKLENQKQINNVEFNFARRFVTMYILNGLLKEAMEELKIMIRKKPLNRKTLIGVFKCLFPKTYKKKLKERTKSDQY